MGVTGLWTVVQPCARPIKLETLNRKRLAVDASIWIYQFLKAVRDKEGNALRNSHVVGFFRRICKLLFFGIKPVFVFDGGAPVLKRQTVSSRKARREGRRDDAVRTAGKLLAVQMQRRAEEEDQRRKEEAERSRQDEQEEEVPENAVYVDELQMSAQERAQGRSFKKKDAYHLPNLDVDISDLGAPNDPRIMSHEELEEYARQFHTGEDVNLYDFSKIDFESTFFKSLPASDRYNILNAARLRSRLRMGYSKDQLDTMFPNRMDFSRFQIERVRERNELTQRLMNINGIGSEDFGVDAGARIAGEKGKEYVLVKNDGVEGGWALGVVSNKTEGQRSRPIDVEHLNKEHEETEDEDVEWQEEGFEDVPIEGLNRLPKRKNQQQTTVPLDSEELALRRRALYEARLEKANPKARKPEELPGTEDPDALFVQQEKVQADGDSDADELFEDVPEPEHDEDEELSRAIAMSLEKDDDTAASETELPSFAASANAGPRIDQPLQYNKKNAKVGRDFAHLTNARALGEAPNPFGDDNSDEDDFNVHNHDEKPKSNRQTGPRVHGFKRPEPSKKVQNATANANDQSAASTEAVAAEAGFAGPLPFESLNLGKSVLGKKKKKPAAAAEGGFEKDKSDEKAPQPLPPWFSGDIRDDVAKQNAIEEQQFDGADPAGQKGHSRPKQPGLERHETQEIIDVDAPKTTSNEIVPIESSDEGEPDDVMVEDERPIDNEIRMDDVADLMRVEPPVPEPEVSVPVVPKSDDIPMKTGPFDDESDGAVSSNKARPPSRDEAQRSSSRSVAGEEDADDAPLDWSESEPETAEDKTHHQSVSISEPTNAQKQPNNAPSPQSPIEFVDVETENAEGTQPEGIQAGTTEPVVPTLIKEESTGTGLFEGLEADDEHAFSDPEDEDLMRQLAGEAEEHARFASSLNAKSYLENVEEYERELRQLRNQQKKDRRDADEVSHIMITECQQLLRLFGLPYITAPMEAEAQCAALVSMGLVDGIVTDDSDIFLFGGTRVYKNMFNQAKFVECYLTSDLEKEYGLTREKLIRFAHLLGSDYTEGLPTVGPVTALEILSEFDTLEKFAEWWNALQMTPKPRPEDTATAFRRKFRKNATKIFLPNTFPDLRVDHAYLNPEVDPDPQAFQWGVPDLNALRQFLMATIGWSQERTDEVLVPVIKDMNRRENEGTQANITQFFGGGVGVGARQNGAGDGGMADGRGGQAFAPRRRVEGKSKRMETALGKLQRSAKGGEEDDVAGVAGGRADGGEDTPRKRRGRKRADADRDNDEDGDVDVDDNDGETEDGDAEFHVKKKTKKKSAKRRRAAA